MRRTFALLIAPLALGCLRPEPTPVPATPVAAPATSPETPASDASAIESVGTGAYRGSYAEGVPFAQKPAWKAMRESATIAPGARVAESDRVRVTITDAFRKQVNGKPALLIVYRVENLSTEPIKNHARSQASFFAFDAQGSEHQSSGPVLDDAGLWELTKAQTDGETIPPGGSSVGATGFAEIPPDASRLALWFFTIDGGGATTGYGFDLPLADVPTR